jgi:hypothetical protein
MRIEVIIRVLFVGGALSLVVPSGTWAVSYYYVGGLYDVVGVPEKPRPLFTVGQISFDPTLILDESDLAGLTVESGVFAGYAYHDPPPPNVLLKAEFRTAAGDYWYDRDWRPPYWEEGDDSFSWLDVSFRLRFDSDGNLVSGGVSGGYDPFAGNWGFRFGDGARSESGGGSYYGIPYFVDRYHSDLPDDDFSPVWYELIVGSYLMNLGYSADSQQYQSYIADEELWTPTFFTTRPGRWTTDPLEFAALVEANTRLGIAKPPRSYLDIPRIGPPIPGVSDGPPAPAPVPLPAPILLSLAGLAALCGLRLGATRGPGQPARSLARRRSPTKAA